ncbi:MAG TPA: putative metal-binding motif-containing protein, partial [Myxococcota bacterium]|nr:putative metal-binding motif-containing protein [Myxococcota bacterium]
MGLRFVMVAAALCAAPGAARAGYTLYESAALGPTGENQGAELSPQEYLGVRFENPAAWRIDSVGGHMLQTIPSHTGLFAAIVPLDGPDDYPDDNDLSQAIWTTTFEAFPLSAEIEVPAHITLSPGWWGLIFGGGGLFGSTSTGSMPVNNPDIGYPSYFRLREGNWESSNNNKRFIITGTVACVEDTSDTAVQCPEDCDDGYDGDADGWIDCQDEDCWHLVACCDADQDGFDRFEQLCGWGPDCEDHPDVGPAIHPFAPETPDDGIDGDCDGVEVCPADADGDRYGSSSALALSQTLRCDDSPGVATSVDDCVDRGPDADLIHPGAAERPGDGVDQDCDGVESCFDDLDDDDHGNSDLTVIVGVDCSAAPYAAPANDDCDDRSPDAAHRYPGAPDPPGDDVDQDCDGHDECYLDADGDGFGTSVVVEGSSLTCDQGRGVSGVTSDCDDRVVLGLLIHPGAQETPANGVDEDCDGVDACFADLDLDGYGTFVIVHDGAPDCAAALGMSDRADDCDDTSPIAASVHPGAAEIPDDGVDQDCNAVDACFLDLDLDGYGGPVQAPAGVASCDASPGYAGSFTDCLDIGVGAAITYPGAEEIVGDGADQDCDGEDACYVDHDGDGFGGEVPEPAHGFVCGDDPGEVPDAGDCDDGDASVEPAAVEVVADGVDQDCDGLDGCYQDIDGDDWGGGLIVPAAAGDCVLVDRLTDASGDCDDERADIHPNNWDIPYDGVDQDCDGIDRTDVDGDGQLWVGADGLDCDDNHGSVRVGAPEVENGVDDDCDGRIDEGFPSADDDGDGFSEVGGDCDDQHGDVHPGAREVCDGVDQDCDGALDEQTPCFDDDLDGYDEIAGDCNDGDPSVGPGHLEVPDNGVDDDCDGVMTDSLLDVDGDGYTTEGGDCGPFDPSVYPGAPEQPDHADDDCDGVIDEGTVLGDDDGDGYSEARGDCLDADPAVHPGAVEVINGIDDDCDGGVDALGPWGDGDGDGWPAALD